MQLALEKKERLSPSPCMHAASIWGEGKFCLDREFSKNAPYKQKIIFHLASSDKMEQKKFFFAWTVDRWYLRYHTNRTWKDQTHGTIELCSEGGKICMVHG